MWIAELFGIAVQLAWYACCVAIAAALAWGVGKFVELYGQTKAIARSMLKRAAIFSALIGAGILALAYLSWIAKIDPYVHGAVIIGSGVIAAAAKLAEKK